MSIALETEPHASTGLFADLRQMIVAVWERHLRKVAAREAHQDLDRLDRRMLDDIGLRPWDRMTYEFVETGALYAADADRFSPQSPTDAPGRAGGETGWRASADAGWPGSERLGLSSHGIWSSGLRSIERQWG